MADDLFAAAAEERLSGRSPLAARLRPRNLDDVVGQRHLLAPGRPLRALIEGDRLSSVIFWGPPGTGKTSLSRLIAPTTEKVFVELSAVTASVKDVREEIASARHRLGERGTGTILFLDEVHRFNKAQQDTLLPAVEGADRADRRHHRKSALRGQPATDVAIDPVSSPCPRRDRHRRTRPTGARGRGASADADAVEHLAGRAGGDGRHALTSTEVAVALAAARGRPIHVTLDDAEGAVDAKAVRYGRDGHYDVISAFIKSIRGSDADAAVYWLARMLEAGEDPRFIARRMVIHAPEDIGMADPQALLVATAAAQAVEFVGLPEAQLNLAQAAIHLRPHRSRTGSPRRSSRPRPPLVRLAPVRCRRTCVMRITRGRRRSVTAPTTGIPMTTRRVT